MQILTEMERREGLNLLGKTFHRVAVRGVVLRGKQILMVRSAAVGDYKFPGGGLRAGETHEQALSREIQEECGIVLRKLDSEVGAVVEYNASIEPEYEVFKMTSYYYRCQVEDDMGQQHLDDYERELGFMPVWIHIDKAIWRNKQLLRFHRAPGWLRREVFVLEYLRAQLPRNPGL
jgi:8-oxo-dGTP pyrophosphatase MutT (NUDIX family)